MAKRLKAVEQMIDLTKDQCYSLADFIEYNIFDIIRNDTDIDSVEWLANIMDAYRKFKEAGGTDG